MIDFLHAGAFFTLPPNRVFLGRGILHTSKSPRPGSFYFPDFFLINPSPWLHYEIVEEITLKEFTERLAKTSLSCPFKKPKWQPPEKMKFKNAYGSLLSHFRDHSLEKGVPYTFTTTTCSMTIAQLRICILSLLQVVEKNPLYGYGFWDSKHGLLGATPEILFQSPSNSSHIETVACAGTKGKRFIEEKLFNSKELREHQLVIDGITQSIESLGGIAKVTKTQFLQLPQLTHLFTPIEGSFMSKVPFEKLVKALHPTPALGTYPRENGSKWLEELNQHEPRYHYGAPIAFLDRDGNAISAVAIRNIQWRENWMGIAAGCGVTSESDFEAEWDELQLKIASVKELLALT